MDSFTLFVIIGVLPIMFINFFWAKAQVDFLRLYKRKVHTDLPIDFNDVSYLLFDNPLEFVKKIPWLLFGRFMLTFKKYDDLQLNEAAKKVRRYFILTVGAFIFCVIFAFFLVFSHLEPA